MESIKFYFSSLFSFLSSSFSGPVFYGVDDVEGPPPPAATPAADPEPAGTSVQGALKAEEAESQKPVDSNAAETGTRKGAARVRRSRDNPRPKWNKDNGPQGRPIRPKDEPRPTEKKDTHKDNNKDGSDKTPVKRYQPSADELRRLMESIIGIDVEFLYFMAPRVWLWFFNIPAIVQAWIFPFFIRDFETYEYFLHDVTIQGQVIPFVHVTRTRYRWIHPVNTYEFDIEPQLFLGCFSQSTVRDYNTLVNVTFMQVHRGLGDRPILSADINAKLEAIAVLYLHLNPNSVGIGATLRAISQTRPLAPGLYALGSLRTPDQGDTDLDIYWKNPRKPSRANYVARLLFPELAGIVHPLYIPARTDTEYLKAFAKRLTHPPFVPTDLEIFTHAPNHAHDVQHIDLEKMLPIIDNTVNWFLSDVIGEHKSLPYADKDTILAECVKHARIRFTDRKQREAYVEGARIALFEDRISTNFKDMVKACTDIGCFDKGEGYPEPKPLRFIMCPKVKARGFTHALLYNAQHRLFGVKDGLRNSFSVKYLNDVERLAYVKERFGTSKVINTDYSSMEASISKYMMNHIERKIFGALCAPDERLKIKALWDQYTTVKYHVSNDEYAFDMEPMRLSGQEHTSSGNFICNFVWFASFIFVRTGFYPKVSEYKFLAEGDDGLCTQEVTLDDGSVYTIEPDVFSDLAATIGAKLKINAYDTLDDASFCGIKLTPGMVKEAPAEVLDLDTDYVLSKVAWMIDYNPQSSRHDRYYGYARCLSYMLRAQYNPELYNCLFYLAYYSQPSYNIARTAHFRNVWLRTFYKGDNLDECEVKDNYRLKKYCQKFDLPYCENPVRPDRLNVSGPANLFMEEVELGTVPMGGWEDFAYEVAGMLVPSLYETNKRRWDKQAGYKIVHESSGDCAVSAMWYYLHHTDQISRQDEHEDYDVWFERHASHFMSRKSFARYIPGLNKDCGVTEEQMISMLEPGQHVVVEDLCGRVFRYRRTDDGRIVRRAAQRGDSLFIRLGYMAWFGHAEVVQRDEEGSEPVNVVYYGLPSVLMVLCVILAAIYFLGFWWYRKATVMGIPLALAVAVAKMAILYFEVKIKIPMPGLAFLAFVLIPNYVWYVVVLAIVALVVGLYLLHSKRKSQAIKNLRRWLFKKPGDWICNIMGILGMQFLRLLHAYPRMTGYGLFFCTFVLPIILYVRSWFVPSYY